MVKLTMTSILLLGKNEYQSYPPKPNFQNRLPPLAAPESRHSEQHGVQSVRSGLSGPSKVSIHLAKRMSGSSATRATTTSPKKGRSRSDRPWPIAKPDRRRVGLPPIDGADVGGGVRPFAPVREDGRVTPLPSR